MMSHRRLPWIKKTALALTLLLAAAQALPAFARQTRASSQASGNAPGAKFELTINNIMRGPGLVGYPPASVRWSPDSQRVFFQWKQAGERPEKEADTYVVNRDGSGLRKLSQEEARNAPPVEGELSRDKKLTLFDENGDIFIYDNAAGQRRQITNTTDVETNPGFTRDQRRVYFTRSNNLFVLSLDTGSLVQLTDVRAGGAPPQAGQGGQGRGGPQQRGTESQEYLKKEERELLDVVKRRAQKKEEDEERRKRENPRKPFNLGPRQSVATLQLSPDEKYVFALVTESGEGARNTIVPNYVTETAFTEDIPARTKVGDRQTRARLAVLNASTGDVSWVDHGQKQVALKTETRTEKTSVDKVERRESEQTQQQTGARQAEEGKRDDQAEQRERDVRLSQPLWSDDGTKALILARSSDNKDRWILSLDPATAKTRVIASDHDDAWIDGPGNFTLGWMRDNQHIYFQSERTGYAHLYTVSYEGGKPAQLTSGRWEVTGVTLSDDKSRFFLTTSEAHPGERHVYAMAAEGGERVKITSMPGNNQAFISPDEKHLALI
ncbi:MAG TPA: DPP IV N-terminal domain-containing protein, partial [Blastocatellia bacterium]|nr:DPP IV N-terminal domain-containing protein [Blastocatellia bacterium]